MVIFMKKLGIMSFIFIIVDILVKVMVNSFMNVYDTICLIPSFFSITYVRNVGAAFSIMENNRILFIVVGIVALFLIYKYLIKDKVLNNYYIVCYSMLIGGIIGNLIDRLVYGYVIDYLSFNIFGYLFPIFNLADSFIVISVFMIIIYEIKERGNDGKNSS